ncbi:PRTRC system ParB family protein [Rhodanobacter denitrificans]|uniref:PRTRC system ParB family protein n=1 Tax=Rhodanobacter denitrificans TaxID=666685 RepID=M4NG45_9GAMM|nr:PRTRC system ParB family protein [Rhodanobacter denitrificans]AGG89042.1 PRTRC system ParB family protein [Rhodanobacter denitrificans]UJJ53071.1 PRTRC system ParB family protein [Rhodanobacter denitrificans]
MTTSEHDYEHSTGETRVVPLSSISVQPGFNPRRAFRPADMDRLVASIREQGVIQPPLVRPRHDGEEGFWLVAGERRFRACTLLNKAELPVLVREMDDAQARLAALCENMDRKDLSAAEEAIAARHALDLAGGDKAATASQLGWSATKLEARLLLLTASAAVLQALADGAIHVGHAELLAGLPEASQDKALGRIIEGQVSVADLREQVKGIVIPLSTAIFDTTACAKCPFNTQLQGSLFGDAVAGAHCKNRACFTAKTNEAIEAKRAALAEEVGTVALSTEKDPDSYVPLVVNGEGGVGRAQFEQCRTCQHFGALIHAKADGRLGQVERPMCFERTCHSQKVAAHAAELAALAEEASGSSPVAAGNPSPGTAPAGKAKAKPKVKPAPKKAAPAASPSGARTAMKPAFVAAARELLTTDPRVGLALAVMALSKVAREAGLDPATAPRPTPEESVATLLKLDANALAAKYREVCEQLVSGDLRSAYSRNDVFPIVIAARVTQALQGGPGSHFKVTAEFLAAHTREGISALLAESGFEKWLKEQEDGAAKWKALMSLKKSELPAAVMEKGFEWAGFVPASVQNVTPRSLVGV